MQNVKTVKNGLFKVKETIKERLENVLICEEGNGGFDDGGATGWLKGQAISIVIIILLLGLVTVFVPQFWTKITAYFMGLF